MIEQKKTTTQKAVPKKAAPKKKAKARKPAAKPAMVAVVPVVPVAADGWPVCPNHLRKSGQSVWAKGEPLWNRGEITVQDVDAYLMYCEAFDELDHCYAVLAQQGEYQESSQGGSKNIQHCEGSERSRARSLDTRGYLVWSLRHEKSGLQYSKESRRGNALKPWTQLLGLGSEINQTS